MIKPLGSDNLNPLYVVDDAKRAALIEEAKGLPSIVISSAAAGNAVMLGGGYFNPLTGYMNVADSMSVAENMRTTSDHGVQRYGEALYKAGKTGEAESAFERVLFLTSKSFSRRKWEDRHKQLHYLLRYCGKWGKTPPDTVP